MTQPVDKSAQIVLLEEILQARFTDTEHKRNPDGLTFVEDETVMDRLDQALGVGGWSVPNASVLSDGTVQITLGIRHPETGEWTYYTDFGSPTNGVSKESAKEAWTDAFRRVSRLVGVARYVYAGEAAAPPAPMLVPGPQGAVVPLPPPPQYQSQAAPAGVCPVHGREWRAGKYGPYCTAKALPNESQNKNGYCDLKP